MFWRAVANIATPPVEWVPAEGRWWVIRIVVPAVTVAILLTFFFFEWRIDPTWAAANSLYAYALIFGALAVEFIFLYAFPSVRRIGISPLCLVVDVGIRRFSYPWPEVKQVTRTRVQQFRWNQVSSVSRTRISVGSGVFMNWFALSPQQGDRLAQFLRIP